MRNLPDIRSLAALAALLVSLISFVVLTGIGHPIEANNILKEIGLPALTLFVGLESDTKGDN